MTRSDLDNNGAQKVPKCQCYQLSGVQVQGCGSKLRKVGEDDDGDDADDADDDGDAAPANDDD